MTSISPPEGQDKTLFTPAPWEASANAYGVWFVHGGPEAENRLGTKYKALVCGGNSHDTLTEANARLIAAAPALYDAGRFLLDIADALLENGGAPADAAREQMRAALNQVRAIL